MDDRLIMAGGERFSPADMYEGRDTPNNIGAVVASFMLGNPTTITAASPAYVGSTAADSGANYQLNVVTYMTVTAGNTVVLSVGNTNTGTGAPQTVTDSLGNTYTRIGFTNSDYRSGALFIGYITTGGAAVITAVGNNSDYVQWTIVGQQFAGILNPSPVDVFTVLSDGAGAYPQAHTASLTTTGANEMFVMGYVGSDAADSYITTQGFTDVTNNTNTSTAGGQSASAMASRIAATAGVQSGTIQGSSYSNGIVMAVALKPGGTTTVVQNEQPPMGTRIDGWYPYGVKPAMDMSALATIAANYYAYYRDRYVVTTGMPAGMPAGAKRVYRPENDNDTVSEGMGYMLIGAATYNEKALFDALWKYVKYYLNANGLMKYRINADGTVFDGGGATDADYDILMALCMAHTAWGSSGTVNYLAEAQAMETAVLTYEHYSATHTNTALRNVMINGDLFDPSQSGTPNIVDPDYFAPGYYTYWAAFFGHSRWLDIKKANYPIMVGVYDQNYNTGLVPDHANRTGGPSTVSGLTGYKYTYNAVRRFRQVVDYLWYGPDATNDPNYTGYYFHRKMSNFMLAQSGGVIANLRAEWPIDGSAPAEYVNNTFISSYGAAMVLNGDNSQFAKDIVNYQASTKDGSYFGDSVSFMNLLVMTGQFIPNPTFAPSGSNLTKNNADSVSATDAASRRVGRPLADTVTATDAQLIMLGRRLTLADTISTSDAYMRAVKKAGLSDSVTATDATTQQAGKRQTIADSVTAADALSKRFSDTQADTATVADALSKRYMDSVNDTTTTTDAQSRRTTKQAADSVTVSDLTTQRVGRYAIFADSVTIADVLSKRAGQRSLDEVYAWDYRTNMFANPSFETNTTGWDLGTGFSRDAAAAYIGGYGITQNTASGTAYIGTVEGTGFDTSNATTYTISFYAKINVISGSAPRVVIMNAQYQALGTVLLAQTITPVDNTWRRYSFTFTTWAMEAKASFRIENQGGNVQASYDGFQLERGSQATPYLEGTMQGFSATLLRQVIVNDSVAATDASRRGVYLGKADTISLTDATARAGAYNRTIADIVTTADALSKRYTDNIADSTAAADALSKRFTDRLADTATLIDANSKRVTRPAADSVTASDLANAQLVQALNTTAADSVGVIDAITRIAVGKRIADSQATADALSKRFTDRLADTATPVDATSKRSSATKMDFIDVQPRQYGRNLGGYGVNVATPINPATQQQVAFAFDFRLNDRSQQRQIFNLGNRLDVNTEKGSDKIFAWWDYPQGVGHLIGKTNNSMLDAQFHTLIINKTATEIRFLVDGVLVGSYAETNLSQNGPGATINYGQEFIDMTNVRTWSRSLTTAEEAAISAGGAIPRTGLTMEHLYSDQTGSTVTDTSGAGRNGTVNNAAAFEWHSSPGDVISNRPSKAAADSVSPVEGMSKTVYKLWRDQINAYDHDNMVPNGDFEMAGPNQTPTYFQDNIIGFGNTLNMGVAANYATLRQYRWAVNAYGVTQPAGAIYDATVSHSGQYSLKMVSQNNQERVNFKLGNRNYGDLNDPRDIQQNLLPVKPSTTYRFGIWYKQDVTSVTGTPHTTNQMLWLAEHSPTGYNKGTNIYRDDTVTADWRYKEVTFTTRNDTYYLNIWGGMTGNGANQWSGTLWVDDMTLVEVTAPLVKAVGKNLMDSVTVIDSIVQGAVRYLALADSIAATDSSTRRVILKPADLATAIDASLRRITKRNADTATTADSPSKRFTNYEADTTAATDAALRNIGKRPADSITLSDTQRKAFVRANSDTVVLTDVLSKRIARKVADTQGLTDLSRRNVRKLLADGTVVADAINKAITIYPADVIDLSDGALNDLVAKVYRDIEAISARGNTVRSGNIISRSKRQ